MTKYEMAVLYDPGLEVDLEKGLDKIAKIFDEAKAKITKTDNWGKEKTAYPIKGQNHAIYVFYTVEMLPENVNKIEADFRITDEINRFLITKIDLKAEAKAKAAKDDQKDEKIDEKKQQEEE